MSYVYDENANDNVHEAEIPGNVPGACPPQLIKFRIYPEVDFNELFGDPPASVIT